MVNKQKFSDLKYRYPDFEKIQQQLEVLTKGVQDAPNYEAYKACFLAYDQMTQEMDYQMTLAFIRLYLDCTDTYYQEELGKMQQGEIGINLAPFNDALVASPYAQQLEEEYGSELLAIIKAQSRLKGEGKEHLLAIEALQNKYQQLKASLQIEWNGQVYSEAEMNKFNEHPDRDVRKAAKIAYYEALLAQKEEWARILDELVQHRVALAKANGYEDYLSYINEERGRRGYGEKELTRFTAQIKEEAVPLLRKLLDAQCKRIGVEKLNGYDRGLLFCDGNAQHIGEAGILKAAGEMYDDLAEDIGMLYDTLVAYEMIDLKASPHKISNMGFCTLLKPLKMPYVFGNCNDTPFDVNVLTHEVGHAYQGYLSMQHQPLTYYYDQVNDIKEIPSKVMEQFAYDYAEAFFGETKDKFLIDHQQGVIEEMCGYAAVNDFENYLYTYPEATLEARIEVFNRTMQAYAQIEEDDALDGFIQQGVLLYRQMGIYMFPKYLISYALSLMSACEFRNKMDEDKEKAWADYTAFCSAGGSRTYLELLEMANLTVPFEEGAVRTCLASLKERLEELL